MGSKLLTFRTTTQEEPHALEVLRHIPKANALIMMPAEFSLLLQGLLSGALIPQEMVLSVLLKIQGTVDAIVFCLQMDVQTKD